MRMHLLTPVESSGMFRVIPHIQPQVRRPESPKPRLFLGWGALTGCGFEGGPCPSYLVLGLQEALEVLQDWGFSSPTVLVGFQDPW